MTFRCTGRAAQICQDSLHYVQELDGLMLGNGRLEQAQVAEQALQTRDFLASERYDFLSRCGTKLRRFYKMTEEQ